MKWWMVLLVLMGPARMSEGTSVRQPRLQCITAVDLTVNLDPGCWDEVDTTRAVTKSGEIEESLEHELASSLKRAGIAVSADSWAALRVEVDAEQLSENASRRFALFVNATLEEPVKIKRADGLEIAARGSTWSHKDSATCSPSELIDVLKRLCREAIEQFAGEVQQDTSAARCKGASGG